VDFAELQKLEMHTTRIIGNDDQVEDEDEEQEFDRQGLLDG